MEYADYDFYTDVYAGIAIKAEEWAQYSARAQNLIDSITRYAVAKNGISAFDDFTQNQIKMAVCAQADYLAYIGIDAATTGRAGTSFTVGNVSVNYGSRYGNTQTTGAAISVAPAALALLEPTGLIYRGIDAPVEPFTPFPFWR